jgi:hypothetical protein
LAAFVTQAAVLDALPVAMGLDDREEVSWETVEFDTGMAEIDGDSVEIDAGTDECASKETGDRRRENRNGAFDLSHICQQQADMGHPHWFVHEHGFSSPRTEKPRRWRGFFFSYSISSEYHIGGISRPNMIRCKWRVITESYFG